MAISLLSICVKWRTLITCKFCPITAVEFELSLSPKTPRKNEDSEGLKMLFVCLRRLILRIAREIEEKVKVGGSKKAFSHESQARFEDSNSLKMTRA
jgi:hypothetical protein